MIISNERDSVLIGESQSSRVGVVEGVVAMRKCTFASSLASSIGNRERPRRRTVARMGCLS